MPSKPFKVIIDTNLWIKFLISDDFNYIDDLIIEGKINLIFSQELLNEIITVMIRPKFKKYFAKKDIEKLLSLFERFGVFVNVKSIVKLCRDPKDDFLLSLSMDSNADYLITGDKDLLELVEIKDTKIITIVEFKNILNL